MRNAAIISASLFILVGTFFIITDCETFPKHANYQFVCLPADD